MEADIDGKAIAFPLGQELRVAQAGDGSSRMEDHGRRHHGPRQRAASGLVDAGHDRAGRKRQQGTPAARSSPATASAATLPVSTASDAAKPANSASRRRRVTMSS